MKPGVGLIGKKLGMTTVFREDGRPVPVTVLEAGPCKVTAAKTEETDGYRAVQLGFEGLKRKKVLREFRLAKEEKHEVGSTVTVELFKAGDRVDVTGTSVGQGFQGGVKRWHWKGGPQTHGSMSHRRPGSIGSSTDPSRVFKGHHLPGRMGGERVTTQALEIVRVDSANHLLLVKGSVPGHEEALVLIRKSRKPPRVPAARPASAKKKETKAAAPAKEKKAAAPAPGAKK
ncbi:MAG: 50S ribosomal protein L3 [Candidatus Omnitrophica bacterium]|nr:50S ribosomal protein L3 [Candidatus Omnitrophota bacterium]